MKKIVFLFAVAVLIACSESENDIAMVNHDESLAEVNLSSGLEQPSAEKKVLSSSSQMDLEINDVPCDSDNKRIRASENGRYNEYICYNGKWHYSVEWTCEYPKDYYFNPDIEYGTLIDERDGETYRTVDVNGKIWMAENLRLVTDVSQSVPFDDNCKIAGRFYSAGAAQTACPAGWRLPDTTDLNAFFPPDFDKLSGYEMSSYLEQFVSEIGNHCNGYGCNTYGTTILALGVYELASEKMNAMGNSHYWIYDDRDAKKVMQCTLIIR